MIIKAELKNYRQSPRKVRIVTDLIRGKKVDRALIELDFLNKKASLAIKKLIASAVANAKHNFNIEKDTLFIKEIRVDEGVVLKRWRAGAKGRAFPLKKRSSRVFVSLAQEGEDSSTQTEKVEKTEKKAVVKKEVAKKAPTKKIEKNKVVKKETK